MSVRPHPKQKTDPEYSDAWLVDFYDESGKRRKIMRRGTEAQVRAIEQSWRIATKKTVLAASPTLNEAAKLYLEDYAVDHLPSGTERTIRSLKIILSHFGRYSFRSITAPLVEEYKRTRLSDGVKPSTINKELACLSGMCKWANERGYCERIQIKRFPNKLSRAPFPIVPSRKEIVLFLRAIPRSKRGIWAAMYYCGLRSSEARNLRPQDVNLSLGMLIVTGKGNKQRPVPIARKLRPYLRHIPFYAPNDLREVAKWACNRAGITTYIHPHLMRHAFGVHAVASGVHIRALQEIMGHSSVQVTEMYSRMAVEYLAGEMEKM